MSATAPVGFRVNRVIATTLLVAGFCSFAGAGRLHAEPLAWDQARVTELAEAFSSALRSLLTDPGLAPTQRSAIQERKHAGAIASVRATERASRQLVEMLRDGRDRDPTKGVYDDMRGVLDGARALAEDSWLDPTAEEKASRARSILTQLGEYYRG